MCGIVCAFDLKQKADDLRPQVLEMSKSRHRGPDWSGIHTAKNAILAHERLAIVDPLQADNLFIMVTELLYLQLMVRYTITESLELR